MSDENAHGLLYGPPAPRISRSVESAHLRLESEVIHAVESGGWEDVAEVLEGARDLILGEEGGTRLLELAVAALPVAGAYPETGPEPHLAGGKFGGTPLGELPPSEVAVELGEALGAGRSLAPLSFGLPRALYANRNHLAAGRLLAARTARWEESVPLELDPDVGLEELFAVPEVERGTVWEKAGDSLISASARCAYEEDGHLLARQLQRLTAGPDLRARHLPDCGVDIMHLCSEPVSDRAVCGRDLAGFDYGLPGEWARRLGSEDPLELACGECLGWTTADDHPSYRRVESTGDAGEATAAAISVGVRIRLSRRSKVVPPRDPSDFRLRVSEALHDAVVYWAAIHLCDVENDLRWQRLAGPLIHPDPQLRKLDRLPEMEEETATKLLAAFAEPGPARSPSEFRLRRRESWRRSWLELRDLAGFGNRR